MEALFPFHKNRVLSGKGPVFILIEEMRVACMHL